MDRITDRSDMTSAVYCGCKASNESEQNFNFDFFAVKSRCPRKGSMCSHLCLLVPGGYSCACPENSTFIEGSQNICDAGNGHLRLKKF